MPYGSPKQLAFFKAQAIKFNLFPPCPEQSGDIFDFEGLKRQHEERLKRAVAGLRAIRVRRKIAKYRRGADARARKAGFKNHEERLAAGWTPLDGIRKAAQAKRKKHRVVANDKGKALFAPREESPFVTDEMRRAAAWDRYSSSMF